MHEVVHVCRDVRVHDRRVDHLAVDGEQRPEDDADEDADGEGQAGVQAVFEAAQQAWGGGVPPPPPREVVDEAHEEVGRLDPQVPKRQELPGPAELSYVDDVGMTLQRFRNLRVKKKIKL